MHTRHVGGVWDATTCTSTELYLYEYFSKILYPYVDSRATVHLPGYSGRVSCTEVFSMTKLDRKLVVSSSCLRSKMNSVSMLTVDNYNNNIQKDKVSFSRIFLIY